MTPRIGDSYAERNARERAQALLDPGAFREVLGPFARLRSPYLAAQGIASQSDDGVVVARGTLAGVRACVVATDGRFLGGAIGEIGGAKIAASLELARRDAERGTPTRVVLALDTGGVRLQEANLGLLAIAEICDAVVALRAHQPVVAVIAGRVGVYGGMSIVSALCNEVIVTEGARVGLNGPDVVETEAGADEFDASNRPLVWRLTGGRRRFAQGYATALVADDLPDIRAAVEEAFVRNRPFVAIERPDFPDPNLERDAFLRAYGVAP